MKRFDWGTVLSLTAVGVVSVCVAVQAMPAMPAPPSSPPREDPGGEHPRAAARTDRSATHRPVKASPTPKAGLRINEPDRSIELAANLNEISDIALAKGGESLWAVHDERGTLFRISVLDGSIQQEVDLGKRGDFEGVAEAGGLVYVARSEGVLLVVDPSGEKDLEKLVFAKDLGLACDLEGLAHDARANRLLLACKNEGWRSSRKDGKVYELYAMDLETRKVKDEPVFTIRVKDLDDRGVKGKAFGPSGVAVHPKTGEIYVISSRGSALVVLSREGEILRVEKIDSDVHLQPEGIAFAEDGTMYISDEAHGHHAKLHVIKE